METFEKCSISFKFKEGERGRFAKVSHGAAVYGGAMSFVII